MDQNQKWDSRYMEMARFVSKWSNCIREGRQVGAVLARDKHLLSMGYNGAPAGIKSCAERGECIRKKRNIPSGTTLELCYSVCAEQKAIAGAASVGVGIDGATLYSTHRPCTTCTRLIIGSGISRVVYENDYPDDFSASMMKESDVIFEKYQA